MSGTDSATWLTRVLSRSGQLRAGQVTVAEASEIAAGSLNGQLLRIRIGYSDDAAGELPETVVVKLPATDPKRHRVARRLGHYAAEAAFYRDAAPRTPVRLPRCLMVQGLPEPGTFAFVLEDLGSTTRQVSWATGLEVHQAQAVVGWLGRFHATWADQTDSLPAPLRRPVPLTEPAALTRLGGRVGPGHRNLCARVTRDHAALLERAMQHPAQRTLRHGDLHTGNIFLAENGPPAVLDWQFAGVGTGLVELAVFLCLTMPPVLRHRHDRELLRCYLAERGYRDLSPRCLDAYRLALCLALIEAAAVLTRGQPGSVAMDCLNRVLLACDDWRASDVLD